MFDQAMTAAEWLLCGLIYLCVHWEKAAFVGLLIALVYWAVLVIKTRGDMRKRAMRFEVEPLRSKPASPVLWFAYVFPGRKHELRICDEDRVAQRWFPSGR